MADRRYDEQDEWMLVDIREHEPVAVGESEVERVEEEEGKKMEMSLMDGGVGMMKTYFICDGTPKELFEKLPEMEPRRPKAILLVFSNRQSSNSGDFSGLTSHVNYEVRATAKGAPDLAEKAKELLLKAGIRSVTHESLLRRMEHAGTKSTVSTSSNFISDVPICQLSVQSKKGALFHYNLGRALAPLRHEGVLILGLCNNVGVSNPQSNGPPDIWAEAFDKWLHDSLLNNRFEEIIQFENKIPHAGIVPLLSEGLYPLLVVLGAAGQGAVAEQVHNGWSFCSHS
uniref:Extradiol ring-cleavage dioxygenase class III enzyme subunit B domain-containing protein n=1 Tax=Araucaria cunninghamii TaxID=56994 RepID=A0A0D6R6D1_ARACU